MTSAWPPSFAVGADFARDARDFARKRIELIDHRIDGVLQLQNFALNVHRDLARQVSVRHRRGHLSDVANLSRQVARHRVHAIREILPCSSDATDIRLTAELTFGSDFARHTRHFRGERAELIHHRIDGVLQLQNFASHVHRDLARQVAARHGRGNFGDVANLVGQVTRHEIDVVCQILPRSGNAAHIRLAAQLAFRPDFARHAGYFRRERAELIHHRVDGVLQLENFAARVHRNLRGQISARDGRSYARDVANLVGQVARHVIDAIRQILPGARYAAYVRLAAKLAFGTNFTRHARHFTEQTR